MNILFDQTEAQALFFNGAAEYAQTVFLRLAERLGEYPDVHVFSLYSSDRAFRYKQLSPENLKKFERVTCVDYKGKTLRQVVRENNIDLLFITCAQAFCDLPLGALDDVGCKVVAVIHDFLDEEMGYSKMETFKYMETPRKLLRYWLSRTKVRLLSGNLKGRRKLMLSMLENNDADIVTVSEYSRCSLRYNYPQLKNSVHVFFSPMKTVAETGGEIENEVLRSLAANGTRYLLLLSADRVLKNARSMLRAFSRFCATTETDMRIVTIGYAKKEFAEHISLPFLSSSDLEQAYKHCYALLYPSLFEGFGYPPLEAMKYGKPVISSNVCSMPEVLEDAPVYFSPVYETDMYRALNKFVATPYEELGERALRQFNKVAGKQKADLDRLTKMLLDGSFV